MVKQWLYIFGLAVQYITLLPMLCIQTKVELLTVQSEQSHSCFTVFTPTVPTMLVVVKKYFIYLD